MTDERDVERIHDSDDSDEDSISEKCCSYAYHPAIHAFCHLCISRLRRTGMGIQRETTAEPSSHNHNHRNPLPPSRYHANVLLEQKRRRHHPLLPRLPRTSSYFSIWRLSLPSVPLPLSLLHATTLRHAFAYQPPPPPAGTGTGQDANAVGSSLSTPQLIRTQTPNNPMGIHPLSLHLYATNLHHLRHPDTISFTCLTLVRCIF